MPTANRYSKFDCLSPPKAWWLGILCFIFSVLLSSLTSAQAELAPNDPLPERLAFSHILPEELESLGHINAIAEDAYGFMWLAGKSGLARFDGYDLRFYRHDDQDPRSLPHNWVSDLMVDHHGVLWVASGGGLSRYHLEEDRFQTYSSLSTEQNKLGHVHVLMDAPEQQGLWLGADDGLWFFDKMAASFAHINASDTSFIVWDISRAANGLIWLATNQGLKAWDADQSSFQPLQTGFQVDNLEARSVLVDREDGLWVGSAGGALFYVDPNRNNVTHYTAKDPLVVDVIWRIQEDDLGRIWVGDGAGVAIVDRREKHLHRFAHNPLDPFSPAGLAVRDIYQDSRGKMWMGYYPSGVDRVNWLAALFEHHWHNPTDSNTVLDGGVLDAVEDPWGNLWIGNGHGLSFYNRGNKTFRHWTHQLGDETSLLSSAITSLKLDRRGDLWIGSWPKGVTHLSLVDKNLTHYRATSDGQQGSIVGGEPWDILEDASGEVWVATNKGLNRLDRQANRFELIPVATSSQRLGGILARTLLEDDEQTLWVGSNAGIYRFSAQDNKLILHSKLPAGGALTTLSVRALFDGGKGSLWVGSQGNGLFRMEKATGELVPAQFGAALSQATITGIVQDRQGVLWLTTLRGVIRLDLATGISRKITTRHGLLDNVHNHGAATLLQSGEILLGSTKGFSLFEPQGVAAGIRPASLVFTDLKVLNVSEPVSGQDNKTLTQNVVLSPNIELAPSQNIFSLSFSDLSYQVAEDIRFQYRLSGFDDRWLWADRERTATFTNLDPGKYTLAVRAQGTDGQWAPNEAAIQIQVLAPWWQSWWANVLAAAVLGLVFLAVSNTYFKQLELRQEKRLNAKLRRLDKVKDTFLANTSHELRTPLNGMIGIAESLLDGIEGPLSPRVKQKLTMLNSSGRRLANLVNDILDYSKLTEHSLEVSRHPVDLSALFHDVHHLLNPLAEAKGVALHIASLEGVPWVIGDENRLQQILINLVGNAIKFTDKGQVEVCAELCGEEVKVSVVDTGIGIAPEDLHTVFVAFHQLENAGETRQFNGTGLGLAISKQLVELQGGEVGVTSTLGEGSRFWFTVQTSPGMSASAAQHWPERGARTMPAEPSVQPAIPADDTSQGDRAPVLPLVEKPERFQILLVDDDPVNRMVMRGILEQQKYQVVEAQNGVEALQWIDSGHTVHLVLLDIMMPRLDGFQVCEKIRQQFSLNELPILFLTGYKNDDDLKRGFAVGANEFLTKPVSKYELLGLVANSLRKSNGSRQSVKSKNQIG